ncbi:hypothetical protein O181_094104 [Austropuccinia psidii MF-1]|uniref:Uncharacterized protein n=1 Tax=Austropuccinia psidii MF-1 TaxID=1389203 RepID=A0A9Q3PAI0_9BASI|nr:hypothetical protein [Austropuccinia psidii MF-1]
MKSWPLPEENPWSMDTDISWIEEKEVCTNYINPQELIENPDWFLQIKQEPCPDISTIVLPYIEFEDIFEKENSPSETVIPHPWEELPGFNLTRYEFLELLTWDGIDGNPGNPYWNEIFHMDEHLRKSLFWRTWECQDWFNLQDFEIKNGKISNISRNYFIKNSTWDCHWEETLIPTIFTLRVGATKLNTEEWNSFCQDYLFKSPKTEKWRRGRVLKQELVKKILGKRKKIEGTSPDKSSIS